jgi:anti-anti-sigma factor
MPRFEYVTERHGTAALVRLRGELDIAATAALEPELERLAGEPDVDIVALDLRALDYLDSSGLRPVLATAERLACDERRLVLIPGPSPVQRVFEITHTTERLEFVDAPELD